MVHARQRWPKGPFPERYRWAEVERRLSGAFDEPLRSELAVHLASLGLALDEALADPFVRVFVRRDGRAIDLDAVRAALAGLEVVAFRWLPRAGHEESIERVGVVPSPDPIDAVLAMGVAGPHQGIGSAAIARFLAALGSFADFRVDAVAEDRLVLHIVPRREGAALRIAERVHHLCPGLAGREARDPTTLAESITTHHRLELAW